VEAGTSGTGVGRRLWKKGAAGDVGLDGLEGVRKMGCEVHDDLIRFL